MRDILYKILWIILHLRVKTSLMNRMKKRKSSIVIRNTSSYFTNAKYGGARWEKISEMNRMVKMHHLKDL